MRIKMVRGKGVAITIMAVALTALLLVTACAPMPIVTEKEVKVAGMWPMTGAGGTETQIMVGALQDYLTYFNQQEAIPGVSIKLLWGDTMLLAPQFFSHYERFVERGIPLVFGEESTGLVGLKDRFEQDEVVMFICGAGYTETTYPPGWRYTIIPTIAEQSTIVAEYFRDNWKEERPPRLVFMGISSPWGYQPMAAEKYIESLGFEVLPLEIVPFVVLDATTQLLRLNEEGADLVYIQGHTVTVGPILRDAERLGLLGQMHFAAHPAGVGDRLIEMTGVASEGFLNPRAYPWFDETEVPGIKLMIDNMMKYHGTVRRDGSYFAGWVGGVVVCEAIRRAIENVGYENIDGLAIKEALDGMKDFDVYGLASITYKPDDHRGATKIAAYQVKEGKIVRVSDWREAPMLLPEE